tara:strand:+ start:1558 stop:2145 length:588 start_codon:yes stop_codon:yes gene_type:complete
MGWLRKIGRKIDKGIRKTFGKNGWLKAAATVAALTFAAPIFGTGTMSFKGAVGTGGAATKVAGGAVGKEAVLEETARAAASTASADGTMFKSLTQATGDFLRKKGTQIKELPATLLEQGQDVVADTADSFIKSSIINKAMGSDVEDFGSIKGVQTIGANEQSAIQNSVAAYSFDYPNSRPTIAVPQVQPVFARLT